MITGAVVLTLAGAGTVAFSREATLVWQVVGAEIVAPSPPEALARLRHLGT